MTAPHPESKRRLLITLLLAAFLGGVGAGVAASRLLAPPNRLRITTGDMSGVFDRLDLTPEQRRRADSLAAGSAPRSRAIMIEAAERLRAVSDSVDLELRSLLTPEQRQRLDSLRGEPRIMLKRKTAGLQGAVIDTLLDTTITAHPEP